MKALKPCCLTALCAATAFVTAGASAASNLSSTDLKFAREHIDVIYKSERKVCDSMSGNAKDICLVRAEGHEKVAHAELDLAHSGQPGDMHKVAMAKADAAYELAKERCDDAAGRAKAVCLKEAKVQQAAAAADAKAASKAAEAVAESAALGDSAPYKVEAEKCDALAAAPRSQCLVSAKARFGKN